MTVYLASMAAYAQVRVTGKVTSSEDGQPVIGVNVMLKGTTNHGTVTNFEGVFNLEVPSEESELIFSSIGFVTVTRTAGSSPINVVLDTDAQALEEVVVVGYGGAAKKSDITGAMTVVSAKDFDKQPMINVDQALQGRTTGVQITQNSGSPGGGLKIRVRGANSITGSNDPLVVVDGLIGVDINSVNPSDIETINVLKDASASAIYGNRASNGVILITTKKGKSGKATIEFGTFVSVGELANKFDVLSAREYAEQANAKAIGGGGEALFTEERINELVETSVDYQDEVFRQAVTQNYQLSIRGGNENTNYFISGNYLDQDGIIINSNFKRYNLRTNVNSKLSERLSSALNVNFMRTEGQNNFDRGSQDVDVVKGSVTFDPLTPVRDEFGAYNVFSNSGAGTILKNPVFVANEYLNVRTENTLQSSINFDYQIMEGLTFSLNGGLEYSSVLSKGFSPEDEVNPLNSASQNNDHLLRWQNNLRLRYNKSFGKHNIDGMLIYEQRQTTFNQTWASGTGLTSSGLGFDNIGSSDIQRVGSSYSRRSLRSGIGRAVYNYDERYLVTASARLDQSSVFPNESTGIFPSFALGWNISNESFFSLDAVNNLRLRGGWGVTGNEQIPTRAAFNFLNVGTPWNPNGGAVPTATVGPSRTAANPNLTWEKTIQTNIGVDVGLWSDLVRLSVEVYSKRTEDLLLQTILPGYTGVGTQYVNAGIVDNNGYEIDLGINPISTDKVNWDVNFNFSQNKNEVVELVDGLETLFSNVTIDQVNPTIVQVGQPIGSFYGYQYQGVDRETGNAIYYENEDNDDDRVIIGNPFPDFIFGINNTVTFGNFDFNLFIQGVQGVDVYNRLAMISLGRTGNAPYATSKEVLNSWTPEQPDNALPSQNATNTRQVSSEFIEDASFIRIKNVALGYTLPSVLSEKVSLSKVRFNVSVQNLLTFTSYSGFDPEVSANNSDDKLAGIDNGITPNPRVFSFGLNATF
ncbi:TonB-dependent receptor [Flammeovirga sp. EKP202]|uniref:SusC/RagA family TonB-linked outer membrane protein n=1 Tax=Flammeovirga sp. EKP202 TaxID=2770592 RepID=UPI00165EF0C9|nr:TonB-dependent receptor [Flammeovirga sp. EKP202]MBD0401732.1 TonB-dependent receptor [Flammeovirga sp. EKP202]